MCYNNQESESNKFLERRIPKERLGKKEIEIWMELSPKMQGRFLNPHLYPFKPAFIPQPTYSPT